MFMLLMLAAAGIWAQGLNTPPGVTKDDWEEINFEFNSSVLVDGFPSLLRLGELLQMNPGYKVRVEGHTDVIGGKTYNEKLGLARANAVRDFLVKYGAQANQIEVGTEGKDNPKYPGQKNTFEKTDEARWMNRRVALSVMDAQGRTVSAGTGSTGEAIRAIAQPAAPAPSLTDCCSEVLKRLDKLDDIAKMLKDLGDQNADLRKQLADLKAAQDAMKQGQQVLESKVNEAPKPPTAEEIATAVDAKKDPRFQMLSMNVGMDDTGNTTFSGKGRYFRPYGPNFAFEAQAEYLYFKTQREGQFDFGLVDRIGNWQTGLFASLKHVDLAGDQTGGNLGQAALNVDYIFGRGKLGLFGTKGFWNSGVINSVNATDPVTGAILNHLFLDTYLQVVDQAGVNGTVGLWGNNYLDGNLAYLHSALSGNRVGGTLRFVFPLSNRVAFTVEGGMNETLVGPGNSGRAVVGLMLSNMLRPKEFQAANHALPMDPPRIRYDVVVKKVRKGDDPPIANAGPPQVNVPAGTITLNGSASYSPDGNPITYQWVELSGPTTVTLSAPNSAITTFMAGPTQTYVFKLTVTDNFGAQGIATTSVSTATPVPTQISINFTANPPNISSGQSSTLTWNVTGATAVSIAPTLGTVAFQGSGAVSPTATTTYILTASNGTVQQTAQVTVVVGGTQTQVSYCFATPTNIIAGESATLNWATQNATSVNISPTVGAVAINGNIAVSPTQTTTYVVTAMGAGGTTSNTCSVTVTVSSGALPRIIQFSASPASISTGQSSTLLWVVENADTVSINNGVGSSLSLGGTQSVSPAATTSYTLTATNKTGSVTAMATVNVTVVPPPVITGFTAIPNPSPSPGSQVTLTCNTTGASTITMAGILFLPPTASVPVFPLQTTTYTCVATGATGQTVSQSVTVVVNSGPIPPVYH